MNRTAEQNRQAERQDREHQIKTTIILGQPLSQRQRSYYLLFMATREQAAEFIRNEKKSNIRRKRNEQTRSLI